MTRPSRATQRAFTAIVCAGCAPELGLSVLDGLRATIRRCRHGVLVRTDCLLGPLTCASRPTGRGVLVVLQPCSHDRRPDGPARWIGPINSDDDVEILRDWLERGDWTLQTLPDQLCKHFLSIDRSSRRN